MDDLNQNPKLGSADRPNSYIGRSVPRERAKKLLEGKGKYVDDILLPRMVHLSYVRSPFAHAKIKSINTENACLLYTSPSPRDGQISRMPSSA